MQKELDTADILIKKLNLAPHTEGGYFKRYYQSNKYIMKDDCVKCRAGSAIYYLLKKGQFSAWHSILSDEIWHYYKGGLLEIYEIKKDSSLICHKLGDSLIYNDASYSAVIESRSIFAARIIEGEYILTGCSLHPEFSYDDFILYKKEEMLLKHPNHSDIINMFY
ncbi:MAG: cupin domain-containing protein [Mucispirillum sp.]|nr:cupin domain-containing protein [Mucispirillum sp.]